LAAEQVAREVVGDGERITVATVTRFEVALEVGTPNLVRRGNDRSGMGG
jgi:hypothetical protein